MCPMDDISTPRLGGSTCDTYDSDCLLVFVINLRNEEMFEINNPYTIWDCYYRVHPGIVWFAKACTEYSGYIPRTPRQPTTNPPPPFAVNPRVCWHHGQSTVLYNARRIKDESGMKRGERTIARCSIGIPLVIAARLCISILVTGRPQQGRVPFET